MNRIAILLLSSSFIAHYTYAQRAVREEDMAYYLPKKTTRFKLANQLFELKDTSVISPNAVYVQEMISREYANYQLISETKTYNFIRFFKDGKALISFDYLSYPTEEQFNDFSYCRPAYYTIKDDQVIIEVYQDKQWGVIDMVARRLNNGGLEFYRQAGDPDVKIRKNDKDTSVNRKDNKPKSPFLYKRETAFYRKDYTKLYKWL
jgi:hypothetical protein